MTTNERLSLDPDDGMSILGIHMIRELGYNVASKKRAAVDSQISSGIEFK